MTIVVDIAILVFHANKETYRQYRLKTIMISFLRNKLTKDGKMMKIADVLFLEQKCLKIE